MGGLGYPAENRREVGRFTARLVVLSFDDAAAAHVAEIRANLERPGQEIGGYDTLIAGHARSQGLMAVSGNSREFSRVEGLRAENWLSSPESQRFYRRAMIFEVSACNAQKSHDRLRWKQPQTIMP